MNKTLLCMALLAAGLSRAQAGDCVRSEPSPIFAANRSDIQSHTFTTQSDHEALERFRMAPGISVEARHGGCEYFLTSYRFESPELFAKGYSVTQAYQAGAKLLRQLQQLHAETGFDLVLAAGAMQHGAPALDLELPVRGDGVPPLETTMSLQAAGRQNGMGFVQIVLFRGPL
jgi:hypothetical protein